ncbi:hypothetical protein E3O55_07620 [Cryobacterium sp. MDB1-18-2]|uniref:hypothetical protein n=1 Tax=unclassified Cryobacterium TaxID=2649013 RepID=UPI00106B4B91|nr:MULTISPECIES: hypothetical protein [unclassified Cryobacterium]TFC30739.1 hypothetical protein E3O55_07620 [Cryobacterium sp. MDB1-18-2]TFC38309.1 hypothetical protein E3O50_16775 [Cryobacterium sp. MDB1-18-1]
MEAFYLYAAAILLVTVEGWALFAMQTGHSVPALLALAPIVLLLVFAALALLPIVPFVGVANADMITLAGRLIPWSPWRIRKRQIQKSLSTATMMIRDLQERHSAANARHEKLLEDGKRISISYADDAAVLQQARIEISCLPPGNADVVAESIAAAQLVLDQNRRLEARNMQELEVVFNTLKDIPEVIATMTKFRNEFSDLYDRAKIGYLTESEISHCEDLVKRQARVIADQPF